MSVLEIWGAEYQEQVNAGLNLWVLGNFYVSFNDIVVDLAVCLPGW